MYTICICILNFTVLIVKQSYKVMNVIISNGSCIKESHHTSLHCSRDAKVLCMLSITTKCVKSQQNYLFKKRYKKAPHTRSKKIFKNNSCTKC